MMTFVALDCLEPFFAPNLGPMVRVPPAKLLMPPPRPAPPPPPASPVPALPLPPLLPEAPLPPRPPNPSPPSPPSPPALAPTSLDVKFTVTPVKDTLPALVRPPPSEDPPAPPSPACRAAAEVAEPADAAGA